MRFALERKLIAAFTFSLLVIIVLGVTLARTSTRFLKSETRLDQLNEQRRSLLLTLSTLQDAETGQRGYLLVGKPSYLAPYQSALLAVNTNLDYLTSLFANDPLALTDIGRIRTLSQLKLAELNRTILLCEQGRANEALAIVDSDTGKQYMDQIRWLVGRRLAAERQSISELEVQTHRLSRWVSYFALLLALLVLAILVLAYLRIMSDLREKRRLRARLDHLPSQDELTGLPNRAFFMDWVRYSISLAGREHGKVGVMIIDLDDYQAVNERYGLNAGDNILRELAARMRKDSRDIDVIGRLDGDRFGLLVPHVENEITLSFVAERLIASLSQPLEAANQDVFPGASIGIAVYPEDGGDLQQLVSAASDALDQVKRTNNHHYLFYRHSLNQTASRSAQLRKELLRALDRGELYLVYQPEVDLSSGTMIGVEALLRWHHPALGDISPEEFIPLAEETGQIISIGNWVIREALGQSQIWRTQHHIGLSVSVNLANAQLSYSGLVEYIRQEMSNNQLLASSVWVELTERELMKPGSEPIIEAMSQLGVKICLDDFGTGFSSLGYLKRFPINTIKIDRSFIKDINHDPSDRAVTVSIIQMAHALGISVVAEGIETEAQKAFLVNHGCDYGQGNYFSRPVRGEDLPRLITAWGCAAPLP